MVNSFLDKLKSMKFNANATDRAIVPWSNYKRKKVKLSNANIFIHGYGGIEFWPSDENFDSSLNGDVVVTFYIIGNFSFHTTLPF